MIYVARHGETEWNREGRYQGQRESQLTATGRAQSSALARVLESVSVARVISSPLVRCRDTAEPIAAFHGVPLEHDARLIEIAHGDWEGRLRTEIERDDAATMRAWRESPQRVHFLRGESLEDVRRRWRAFVADVFADGDVVVLTHDVLVRIAILEATHRSVADLWKPRVVNGGYARLAMAHGTWELLNECVDAHLDGIDIDTTHQAL
jgi:phosphoserine phosphatase